MGLIGEYCMERLEVCPLKLIVNHSIQVQNILGQRKKSDIDARVYYIVIRIVRYTVVRVVIRKIKVVTVKDGEGKKENMTTRNDTYISMGEPYI
jgi:hypothetical protein